MFIADKLIHFITESALNRATAFKNCDYDYDIFLP